jgi:hypothetical protein
VGRAQESKTKQKEWNTDSNGRADHADGDQHRGPQVVWTAWSDSPGSQRQSFWVGQWFLVHVDPAEAGESRWRLRFLQALRVTTVAITLHR